LTLEVSEGQLLRHRPTAALASFANPVRGWERLKADTGADLDLLVGATGDHVSRESH
jgi:dihydroxy-acid dehydratase